MENKELKKSIPVELDEELLDAVSGGSESSWEWIPIGMIDTESKTIFEGKEIQPNQQLDLGAHMWVPIGIEDPTRRISLTLSHPSERMITGKDDTL